MASRENNPSTNDINIPSGNGVSRAAAVPPTAAPSPASIYGTVPAFVRELVLGQHDSGHLVPAPPVSLSVAPPAAGPQDQITGLPGSSSGSAGSGRGNVPGRGRGFEQGHGFGRGRGFGQGHGFGRGRGFGHGRGNSGQGSFGQVRRYPNNANLTATPRVARDNSSSCSGGTIISNNPQDATVAARQVMKQTGATYYASNIQALPDSVRRLAAKKHWERTVMYSDSADRNPPEARMSLDTPGPRVTEVEDETPAPETPAVEQSAPEQEAAPKEENDQRGS